MATASERLPVSKITVECDCGKKYRVPASKGGKKITCKKCKEKIRVPRETQISLRSREAILAELGIDASAAKNGYEAEQAKKSKAYHCTKCSDTIPASELKGAYVNGDLLCSGCRASQDIADRRAEQERELAAGKKVGSGGKVAVAGPVDVAAAQRAALGYGFLFLVGIAAPLWVVVSLSLVASLAIGAAVAGIGARIIYRTRTA